VCLAALRCHRRLRRQVGGARELREALARPDHHRPAFQDGQLPTTSYAGTRDTELDGNSTSTNHGGSTAVSADGDDKLEILLSWDISASIPTTAVVTAASITLEVSDKSSDTFTFYEAKQAWNESKATWKVYDTSKNWQVAGGARTIAVSARSAASRRVRPARTPST
jgi:hypothetical protein